MLNETSREYGRGRDLRLKILDLLQLSLTSFLRGFFCVSEPVCEGGEGFHGDNVGNHQQSNETDHDRFKITIMVERYVLLWHQELQSSPWM